MTVGLFLDRDGVINAKAPDGAYVTDWKDFHFLSGVPEALHRVRALAPDTVIVVVTNQRGIARGIVSSEAVDEIHLRMRQQLRANSADVDRIEVCPHEVDTCDCRKPALGLFLRAMAAHPAIQPGTSIVVGDSVADILAGSRLGARTVLVGTEPRRGKVRHEAAKRGASVDLEADSLADAVANERFLNWIAGSQEK